MRGHDHSVLAAIFSDDYHLPLDADGAYRLQLPCTSEQFEQVVDYYHGRLAESFSLQEARRLQHLALELGLPKLAEEIMVRVDRSAADLLQSTTAALQQVTRSLQEGHAPAARPSSPSYFTGSSFTGTRAYPGRPNHPAMAPAFD